MVSGSNFMSYDSSFIKTEIYSNGKTRRLLVSFVHLQMCRYVTNW